MVRPLYSGSSITHLRQIVFAGSSYWYRDTTDLSGEHLAERLDRAGALEWLEWGSAPPTDKVEAVEIRVVYNSSGARIGMRQQVFDGTTIWQRDLDRRGEESPGQQTGTRSATATPGGAYQPPANRWREPAAGGGEGS